ncbi:MAG: hypothetical protein A2233_03805 [Candidatus Kerfeldbacteria bacterium RIFOXYA2_FULL_38_24]|nr:MAG: hypothetical protein A2233_03805 [Candidatus Kerfeldbacteria bacterium RIFOXYA2_FULL_38_24]
MTISLLTKNKLKFTQFILKLFININNFSYTIINSLAVRANGGIHPKHEILKYHDFFLNNIIRSDIVLDIGCGNGALAFDLAATARQIIAIDNVAGNIDLAKNKFKKDNIQYITGDVTTYVFNNKFDALVLSNVLEHIKDRINFLKKISNLSSKFLIRVPLVDRDWLTIYKKNLGLEYKLVKDHFVEYTLETFTDELKSAGLKIETYRINFGEIWAVVKK